MSAELVYRIRPEGADQLRKMVESVRASDDAVKKAAVGLKGYDDASGKSAASLGRNRAAIEANTAATLKLTDALGSLHRAQASVGESSTTAAAGVGRSVAGWNLAYDAALRLAGGVKDAVISFGSLAEAQANTAIRTGLTIKEVGLFEAVAEDNGVAASAYTSAMRTLSHALSENSDESRKAKRALADLGVDVRDQATGALRPMRDIWVDLATAIGGVEDPARRARLAIDILGRGGLEILPNLNAQFASTLSEYERMGVGMDDAQSKAALALDATLDRMNRRWGTFVKDVKAHLAEYALALLADPDTKGLDPSAYVRGGKRVGPDGRIVEYKPKAKLFDFERANNLRDSAIDGSYPSVESVFSVPRLDPAKILAGDALAQSKRAADLRKINDSLQAQATLQDKLRDAQRDRDEAAKIADLGAFARANAEVRSLEARIEGEKRYKEAQAERQRQEKAFAAEIERLVKGANDRDARRTGSYIERAGEGARRLSDSGDLRDELRALEVRTIQANDRILGGPAALRLGAQNSAGGAIAGQFSAALSEGTKLWDMERDHRLRMIELTAGPGGELAAARAVYDLRIASASTEVERQEARIQLEERLAQLATERLRKYEETAGRVYDSLKQNGGGGLRDFGRGQLEILQRQIFVNASSGIFQRAGGVLGQIGAASGLGGLLRGTIFDPANAQPIDKNTLALNRVGGALDRMYGALTGVPVAGGDGSYSTPAGVFQGGTGLVMSLLGRGGSSSNSTNLGGIFGFAGGGSALTRNQRLLGGIGSGAAAAYGAYAGIRQGGLSGGLTAAGSLAGGLGGILTSLSTASGGAGTPWGAILQGVGLGIGLLGQLFGGNKAAKYEERQARMLDAARYSGPTGRDVLSDGRGGYVDYDYRGNVRVIERPVYVQVQAFDSRSFIDARQDIASAVRQAIIDGTDLSDTVRDLTMPRG